MAGPVVPQYNRDLAELPSYELGYLVLHEKHHLNDYQYVRILNVLCERGSETGFILWHKHYGRDWPRRR